MGRPILNKNISIKDFQDYYWLKEELIEFCCEIGINQTGGKIEISNRISHLLKTGEIITKSNNKKKRKTSNFDWNKEVLSTETLITDNYKNTENVRVFFICKIGKQFKFNVEFMNWMKINIGKTLADAIIEWQRIVIMKKDGNYKTSIAPQFEYNKYMRDSLFDNPELSSKDAMRSWKMKRSKAGNNNYDKSDLLELD